MNEQFRTWHITDHIFKATYRMNLQDRYFYTAFVWSHIILNCTLTFKFDTRCNFYKLIQNITNADILTQRLVWFCLDCQWLFHPNFLHRHPWCARLQGKEMISDAKLEHLIRKNWPVIKCMFSERKLESVLLQAEVWVGALRLLP